MKKIICYISSLASGGAEHQMLILSELLIKKGYDVTLVTCFNYPDHYKPSVELKIVRLNVSGSRIKKQSQISSFLLRQKVDCIISFREQMNFMVLLPMLFKRNVQVIAGERSLTVGRPTFYGWMDLHFLYKRANYIVTNSYSQAEYIRKTKPSYDKKLLTIINYTEIDRFTPSYRFNDGVLSIGIFARYGKEKNYERLAKAVALLKIKSNKLFIVHWYGKICNPGGDIRADYLKFHDLINELGLDDVFQLHDAVKDVSEEMKNLDAICLPSIYEGFSNALSEGICSGKVALAGDISDNKLMVKNGVNGFLFDPYSINDIAEKLFEFISLSPDERLKMSYQSRSIAEELFSAERFVNSYIKLIDSGKN